MTTFPFLRAVSLGSMLLGTLAAADDTRKPPSGGLSPSRMSPSSGSPGNAYQPKGGAAGLRPANGGHGHSTIIQSGGHGPAHLATPLRDGSAIQRDPSGKILEVHASNGAVVWHSPDGVRHFQWERPDGHLIVAHGNGGYIQRPFESRGQPFVQRAYIHAGIASSRFYRPWAYQDMEYEIYVRSRYHQPAFYAWAGSSFRHPYAYRWGWEGRPWYEHYGAYFRSDPAYASPALWLADFTMAAILESAYLPSEHSGAAEPSDQDSSIPAAPALTVEGLPSPVRPDVKRALADEIRRQMQQAKTEQTDGAVRSMPAVFTDHGPRVVLVSAPMMGLTLGNMEIPLAEGDVLEWSAAPDPGEACTEVRVLATRAPGHPRGSVLRVQTEDLVESLNQMQATVDQGLEQLQADSTRAKAGQGQAPFPLPPADAGRDAPFVRDAKAFPGAVAEFTRAAQEADKAEKAAILLAEHPVPETLAHLAGLEDQDQWAAAAARIKVDMDIDEVDRLLGKPDRQASGLDRRTYIYLNGHMKLNFFEDKVAEIVRW